MKRSLGQNKFFFVIFLALERDTTNERGTLVENVKKSNQKSTHPIVQCRYSTVLQRCLELCMSVGNVRYCTKVQYS
jgi:hypothetical protein